MVEEEGGDGGEEEGGEEREGDGDGDELPGDGFGGGLGEYEGGDVILISRESSVLFFIEIGKHDRRISSGGGR